MRFRSFLLQSTNWCEKLTINERWHFFWFWKKAMRKIKYITNTLNQYKYIVKTESSYSRIDYANSFINIIETTLISLCPSFDNVKLYSFVCGRPSHYIEKRLNLKKIEELEKKSKFQKELKSKKFSLNIRFSSNFNHHIYIHM